jgi:hypothetical protein
MGIRGIDICLGHYYLVVFDRVAGRVFIWTALKKKKRNQRPVGKRPERWIKNHSLFISTWIEYENKKILKMITQSDSSDYVVILKIDAQTFFLKKKD